MLEIREDQFERLLRERTKIRRNHPLDRQGMGTCCGMELGKKVADEFGGIFALKERHG